MRKVINTLAFILCLLNLYGLTVHAQEKASSFADLQLTVVPEQAEVMLGEPLVLQLQLNNTTASLVASQSLDPLFGGIQVYLSHAGGKFKRYLGPDWGVREGRPVAVQLEPDQVVSSDITVLFNRSLPGRDDVLAPATPIDEVGVWQILVKLYDINYKRYIVSSVIEIHVTSPTGEGEQAIWQAQQADPDISYFIQTGDAGSHKGVVKKVAKLLEQYPDNVHHRLLARAMGQYYLGRGNASTATIYFKVAAESSSGSFLRAQSLLGLVQSYMQMGSIEEANILNAAAGIEFIQSSAHRQFDLLGEKLRTVREARSVEQNDPREPVP